MSFRDDRRGAALQVGAVLLLGFLVVFLSVYQVTVVPAQNERVEFTHSQAVQGDVLDLRNALLRAGTTTGVQPVTIDMGTRYASRVLFVNPPAPGGLLETGPERNVTLANVSARSAETRDFLNGSHTYTTRSLSYGPSYNVYGSAPTTTVRTGVVVNEFADGASTARSEQTLVRGNEIYLVAVSGNLSRAQVGSLAVDPRTLSAATRTTTVGNATAGPLALTVPTTLSADRWRDLLAAERDPSGTFPGRYVRSVAPVAGADAVRLTLEANETYRIRTAAVGVGTGLSTPDPAYLTNVTDGEPTLRPGDEVVVEVRDRYNNPVDPTTVAGGLRANVTNGTGLVERANVTVDPDGRARFEYVGGAGTDEALNVRLVGRTGARYEVRFAVTGAGNVTGGGQEGGVGGNINPNRTDAVVLDGATIEPEINNGGGNKGTSNVSISLRNLDANEARDIEQARFNFYDVDQRTGKGNNRDRPQSVKLSNRTLRSATNGGQYRTIDPITVPAGGTKTFEVQFYENTGGTDLFDVVDGDFFVLSVVFDDGSTATYFVAPG
jgi:hypothetical protein